ncbi:DJ-1/PfpI family protein [Halospeciosus flavus]|uniref:DJ-1/PfpI family protein n=1 Tax=Halospeciosus flavus TaxID=3032283 RepID=A0ABD5Z6S9_9EURY|nr:DJ-1/PfpI family protein [Halospeciosus flavus]
MHDPASVDTLAVLVYEGFEELDAVGPYEVLGAAGLEPQVVTAEAADRVSGAYGLTVEPDGTVDDVDPDLLVVPGGGWNNRAERGTWAEAQRGVLPERLADLHESGVFLAAVCTGGMLLAYGGVLDGKRATTHHGALDDLRETDADVVEARVVDAGDVVTAGGVTSGIDMALYLVEQLRGPAAADDAADLVEYDRDENVVVVDQ